MIATAPLNLVSAAERAHVRTRHIDEAVALAAVLPCVADERWMDLGTGGGLPGLVLAACRPDVSWVMMDSARKKTEAVQRFAQELELANVTVVGGRAENLAREPAQRGAYDGVVARAVAPLAVLAELARGFLRDGGTLAAVKGPTWSQEAQDAAGALRRLRYGPPSPTPVAFPVRETWLVSIRARGRPPGAYPRRDGVPRSDPLR